MSLQPLLRDVRERLHATWQGMLNRVASPLVVLIYHRVADLPSDPQMLAVQPENFRQQLRALQASFAILRFEADWSRIKRPAVAITFDDGYADNREIALPILEELGVPATFFVTTGYLNGRREFWWDDLERIILLAETGARAEAVGGLVLDRRYDGRVASERAALYQHLHPRIKVLPTPAREQALQALAGLFSGYPAPRATHRTMTTAQVTELAASPLVTLGAHTVWHPTLSSLPLETQRQEIASSRQSLEMLSGKPVPVFSYPFGAKADYSPQTLELCRQIGFSRVAANLQGVVRPWTDPLQVPRFLVRDWPAREMMQRLRRFVGLRRAGS